MTITSCYVNRSRAFNGGLVLVGSSLYEAPHRFIVRGESSTIVSVDEITVEADGDGSLVTYDAELTLKGALKIFDPALSLGFGKVADKAIAGLREALSA